MIDLVFRRTARGDDRFNERFFRRIIENALRALKHTAPVEVSVSLVGPARMRSLNKTYRGTNKPTDVLSFPLGGQGVPGYTVRVLGDIFICEACARVDAEREGMTLERRMAWLTVHGLLHILGYDHERSAAEARRMAALETKILKKL